MHLIIFLFICFRLPTPMCVSVYWNEWKISTGCSRYSCELWEKTLRAIVKSKENLNVILSRTRIQFGFSRWNINCDVVGLIKVSSPSTAFVTLHCSSSQSLPNEVKKESRAYSECVRRQHHHRMIFIFLIFSPHEKSERRRKKVWKKVFFGHIKTCHSCR